MMDKETGKLQFTCHTGRLFKEIVECALPQTEQQALTRPIQIFLIYLEQVARRCSQINDNELNKLMIQMTLYEIADPYSPEYDPRLCEKILKAKG